jgi:hypothetical protein
MNFRATLALIALAAPAFAQHGGMHAGSAGSRGFAGHANFSGHAGISRPGGFARPAQSFRYGGAGAGFREMAPSHYSNLRVPYNGSRFMADRPSFAARSSDLSRTWDRGEDRDRDRFDARRRQFRDWYVTAYPLWLGYGYPYDLDPGFFDWGEPDDSGNDQSGAGVYDQGGPPPPYPAVYPEEDFGAPSEQPEAAAPITATAPEQPLTVIFKDGRAPEKVQNYMMTASVLTDLDPQHYEKIPLDQVDVDATQRVNSAAGVEFEIPGAARD